MAKEHLITYAFETMPTLEGKVIGGLPSVIVQELNERAHTSPADTLVVVSADQQSIALPHMHARIDAADPEPTPNYAKYGYWFDQSWVSLHNRAYQEVTQGKGAEVLSFMMQGDYQETDEVARLAEHFQKYGPLTKNPDAAAAFARRFDNVMSQIKPGSIVGWQDYFFADVIVEHAPRLRAIGCEQTFHLHTTLPERLDAFPDGKQMLRAMSMVDHVYVHTDEYGRRLERQLERMGLRVPQISRFDLGADQRNLREGLESVNKNNYQEHPLYSSLSTDRKTMLDAIYESQDTIPHRFMAIDRPEPGKGTIQLMEAADKYLESLGIGLEEMRGKYRFFFICPDMDLVTDDPYNLRHRYWRYMEPKLAELTQKYPGVVYASLGIPRTFIPSALDGVNIMTGGIEDGLHLANQEGWSVNAMTGRDVNGIMGLGAGFAIQTVQRPGTSDLVYFTRPGNVDDIVASMRDTVRLQQEMPGELQRRTKQIAEEVIFQRNDSIIVR